MDRKRECILNWLLIFLTIVYAVFVTLYDYYRINEYMEGLKQKGDTALGFGVASLVVFVFFNICILGGGSTLLTILLSVFTFSLAKNNGKPKKAKLIATLVCKIIGLGLTIFGASITLGLAYSDGVMKCVYVFMPIAYFCAIMHSTIFFKKIIV